MQIFKSENVKYASDYKIWMWIKM